MYTVGPRGVLFGQPQVGLVDQGGGLQSVIWPLTVQVESGQPAQFVIYTRQRGILIGGCPPACGWIHGDQDSTIVKEVRMSQNWAKIEELFHQAADLLPPERAAFLTDRKSTRLNSSH